MDSSRYPDLIGENYCAMGVNVSFRGGKPKTRPQFKQVAIGDESNSTVKLVRDGMFQGGICYYSTSVGRSILIGCYSGWIIAIDPVLGTSTLLNPSDRNEKTRKTYFLQAENYLVIQNGVDIPLIWDGATATTRRSHTGSNNGVLGTSNTSITNAAGVATVTTQTPHGLAEGAYIQLDGIEVAGYNTQFYAYGVTAYTYKVDVSSTLANPVYPGTTRYCPEIPIGLMMAYGQGRIFVASSNRVEFVAGDIIYGDLKGEVGNILRWTENQYLAEGISFRLPSVQGRITTMVFPAFQDTQAGQGELFVFGEYGTSSFQVSSPRMALTDPTTLAIIQPGWRDIQIQKIVLIGSGCASQWSAVNFTNGDLYYRDLVGVRSYRNARGDMQSYGKTAMSAEVSRILDNDTKTSLLNISGAHVNDRLLMTCTPQFLSRQVRIVSATLTGTVAVVTTADDHGILMGGTFTIADTTGLNGTYTATAVTYNTITFTEVAGSSTAVEYGSYLSGLTSGTEIFHRGILSLDFNSTSTVGAKSYAAWDGVWTGINTQQLVSGFFNGQEQCFAFTYGGVGDNQVWELTNSYGDDISLAGKSKIQCALESRRYNLGVEYNKKKLRRCDLWLTNINGEVSFDVMYKFDGKSCWTDWPPNWKRCATVADIVLPETNVNVENLMQNRPQVRTQITQPTPPNVCDTVQGGITSIGFEVQVRLTWTGNVTVEKMIITADDVVENPRASCPAGATE
ncbi:MAG: hypothetical protein WCL08_00120 [Verrucomicrobiota bacterium]